jgi:uncharacterized Rossmann fold enzyme
MLSLIENLKLLKRNVQRMGSRLKWRINPEYSHSNIVLQSLRNRNHGQKAIILCNGPSLNLVNFDLLKDHFVIGLNKINLMFDRTDFRPDLIVAVNGLVISQNAEFYQSTKIPIFLSHRSKDAIALAPHISFLCAQNGWAFSENAATFVSEGWTVTYVALQLAYHMGFTEVALVGADHNFVQHGKPNETVISTAPDQNHFHPNYFGTGVSWQLADLEGSELAYREARNAFEKDGRQIYNCSVGGKLEIFKRKTLQSFLQA